MKDPVRLSKLMSERGLCSRREADSYIEAGRVFVDGRRISELGTKVDPDCAIRLDAAASARQAERVTIILHKPVGVVSGQPEPGYEPAVALIRAESHWAEDRSPRRFSGEQLKGIAPAGRLDIDSTGLLVLTQDGRIAKQLIGDDSDIEKEYLVRVEGRLDERGLALLNHGLALDGRRLRQADVRWQNADQLRFVLKEGRKRQIRRMCELVGLEVVGLKRVRIGRVRLADLPLGAWRYLGDDESFGRPITGHTLPDPARGTRPAPSADAPRSRPAPSAGWNRPAPRDAGTDARTPEPAPTDALEPRPKRRY